MAVYSANRTGRIPCEKPAKREKNHEASHRKKAGAIKPRPFTKRRTDLRTHLSCG
jgi:hypothetical protein